MGERYLLDTSELLRPTQRKLHSAWAEIHGRKTMMPPTVALELAPLGVPDTVENGLSRAERMLLPGGKKMPAGRRMEVAQQAWWGRMWREEQSPYRVIVLDEEQDRLYRNLLRVIDPGCFRNANPAFVSEHRDTQIICESIAAGATMLMTSNMRSIDRVRVNEWAINNGDRLGFAAEPVLYLADDALLGWTRSDTERERWLQAGLIACWPAKDNAPNDEVLRRAISGVERMTRGTGGKLPGAGRLLVEGLRQHLDPEGLVERTRQMLPSATIRSDREHPTQSKESRSGWKDRVKRQFGIGDTPETPPKVPPPAAGAAGKRGPERDGPPR